MKEICNEFKPTACLDAIAGEMTGKMISYMGDGGTIIIYGGLSG